MKPTVERRRNVTSRDRGDPHLGCARAQTTPLTVSVAESLPRLPLTIIIVSVSLCRVYVFVAFRGEIEVYP